MADQGGTVPMIETYAYVHYGVIIIGAVMAGALFLLRCMVRRLPV